MWVVFLFFVMFFFCISYLSSFSHYCFSTRQWPPRTQATNITASRQPHWCRIAGRISVRLGSWALGWKKPEEHKLAWHVTPNETSHLKSSHTVFGEESDVFSQDAGLQGELRELVLQIGAEVGAAACQITWHSFVLVSMVVYKYVKVMLE